MVLKLHSILVNLILCIVLVTAQFSSSEENVSSETTDELTFDFVKFILPQHYDIHLNISSRNKFRAYDGIVKIKFESKTNSSLLRFISAETINITHVKLVNLGTLEEISDFAMKRVTKFYATTDDAFLVSTNRTIIEQSQVYELEIHFSSTMDTYHDNRGFFASEYKVDNTTSYFAATHFQTKYIRDAIPTFEDLSFKVPIKMRITHHPKFKAISNMPGRVVAGNSERVTTEFDETPPMPGYILAFAVGEFKLKPIPNERNLPFHMYGSSKIFTETDDATAISGKILLGMEDYFNIQYALPKLDYLIIPEFPFYGMENWGLIVFVESKIFGSWKTKKTSDLVLNTVVNAHELAHQYFGNLVTPKEWRHVWLSEGFATFFSYYILNRVFPIDHYNDQFIIDNLFSTFGLYDSNTLNPRSGKSSIYDVAEKINYFKASSIIRMIMHVMGENRFRVATTMYLKQYGYNSTSPNNLTSIYHTVVKEDPDWPMDIRIASFIDSWTNQVGTPILTVRRNYLNGDVELIQEYNNKNNKYNERRTTWWLPYNYASKRNADFYDTSPMGWMKNETTITINLNLHPDDWVIFNKQYTGLYMVNYDERNWELLANELIYGNMELIHEYNRAQLVHDLSRLVDYEQVDIKYLTKLLFYLKREKKYLPWVISDAVLEKFSNILYKKEHEDIFKMAVKYMTSDTYDYYRLNAQQNESKTSLLTRAIVVKWACKFGHQNCLDDFENLSTEYLNSIVSGHTIFVHPDIKEYLFCYGFQNETNYKRLFDYFLANPDHQDASAFLSQFNCKENTKLFRTYYHAYRASTIVNTDEFPGIMKIRWLGPYYYDDLMSVVYQCLVENCFDFRHKTPNEYAQEVSNLVSSILHPRIYSRKQFPRIKQLLLKVEEVYGNETIKLIGGNIRYRYLYYI